MRFKTKASTTLIGICFSSGHWLMFCPYNAIKSIDSDSATAPPIAGCALPSGSGSASYTMAATGPISDALNPKAADTEQKYEAGRAVAATVAPTASSAQRYTPDSMPADVARIVNGACRLFEVRAIACGVGGCHLPVAPFALPHHVIRSCCCCCAL